MGEQARGLSQEGRARRRFLKQAATVAWASPFIVTMMSHRAYAQLQCGTQDVGELGGCVITNPVCSPGPCVPDPTDPGQGNPCICASF